MSNECLIGVFIAFIPILIAMYCWYKFLNIHYNRKPDFNRKIDILRKKIRK